VFHLKPTIKIIKKEANKIIEVTTVKSDYREMQTIVGGPIGVMQLDHGIDMWYNDEFLFDNEANPNIIVENTVIQGTVFFASHNEDGDSISLTTEQIDLVKRQVQKLAFTTLPMYLNVGLEELQYFEMRFAEINAQVHDFEQSISATELEKDGDTND
jgi:uncharacterized pyridoxamine 5'-phosphate oxidase family protein